MKLTTKKSAEESRSRAPALALLLLALFCRLPFFFESVIDWDESTFILIGQSILDGHLPYTQLWDLKPPFAFGFYSLAILLFGKTIASVRFAGALVVALTAFIVNRTAQQLTTVRSGRLAGVLTVLLLSILPSGQAVMSEHVAVLPLTLAFYLLVKRGITNATAFYSGLLLSISAMVRLNTAYVTIGLGLYLLIIGLRQPLANQVLRGLAYSVGSAIPVFLSFFPYWLTGIPQVWWNSVVVASLHRAGIATNSSEVVSQGWSQGWHSALDRVLELDDVGIQILWGVATFIAARAIIKRHKSMHPQQRLGWSLTIVFVWTLQFSMFSTSSFHGHYWLQLVPFLAPVLAVGLDAVIQIRRQLAIAILTLCLCAYPIFNQYALILPRGLANEPLDQSAARQITDYFIDNGLEDQSIYLTSYHIVYWYLETYPLTLSTTHPSTIGRDNVLQVLYGPNWSSHREMKRLLALEPEFILRKDDLFYLKYYPEMAEILQTALDQNYTRVHNIEDINIYRRVA